MTLTGVLSRLKYSWMRLSDAGQYWHPSAFMHYTVEVCRAHPRQIRIGMGARIGKHAWLNVPEGADTDRTIITLAPGVCIGRGSVISGKNQIEIGDDCVTGPYVLIMDHAHEFRDINVPIALQGTTSGGRIVIEPGCWIGFGAAVLCNRGTLRIGRNSVVGANAVVTADVSPYTVVAGVPARPVRRYDASQGAWLVAAGLSSAGDRIDVAGRNH